MKKAAEVNPRKLQQIGLNHDRAHLKASQWNSSSETTKDEKSIPIRESKAPEQVTKVEVVVKQESSTVAPTEGNAAEDGTGPGTVPTDTTKEDEAKREQPSGSAAMALGAPGQERLEPATATADPDGEGEKDPDPVEEKPKAEEEEDDAKAKSGPWNAVCVIGLRVFSKDANLGLHLDES